MLTIEIAYNPYRMKVTTLKIDGRDVLENASGFETMHDFAIKNIPLQSWLDPIEYRNWPGLLKAAGESETEVQCSFTGRKLDFDDLKDSFDNVEGVHVTYDKKNFIFDDDKLLKNVKDAYNRIKGEKFRRIIHHELLKQGEDSELNRAYSELEENYKKAKEREFRIVFSGGFSAGKSTLINALLGKKLLPMDEKTCTSKVFKVMHDPTVSFARMRCVDKHNEIVVEEKIYDEETLTAKFKEMFPRDEKSDRLLPTNPDTVDVIEIFTDMSRLYPERYKDKIKITLIDTPGLGSGTGNDDHHDQITEEAIKSKDKDIVVFCINASHYESQIVRDYLDMADEQQDDPEEYSQRFLFVLNQADAAETDRSKLSNGATEYFKAKADGSKRDICNPRIFFTSALSALYCRTGYGREKFRSEVYSKYYDSWTHEQAENIENYYFERYCSTSQAIKDRIAEQLQLLSGNGDPTNPDTLKNFDLHSGVVSLELAIKDYIEKYAFPLKVQALLDTYQSIFNETKENCNKLRKLFDDTSREKAKTENSIINTEENKKSKEDEKSALDQAHKRIETSKKELDGIVEAFKRSAEGGMDERAKELNNTITKVKDMAKSTYSDSAIKNKTVELLTLAEKDIVKEIEDNYQKSSEKILEKIEEVQSAFSEIQQIFSVKSNYDLSKTVVFKSCGVDLNNLASRTKHNPEYDKGIHLFRKWWAKRKGIDERIPNEKFIDSLNTILQDYKAEFTSSIEKYYQDSKKDFEMTVGKLQSDFERLKSQIDTYSEMIDKWDAKLKEDVKEKGKLQEKLDQLDNNCKYLEEIEELFKEMSIEEE